MKPDSGTSSTPDVPVNTANLPTSLADRSPTQPPKIPLTARIAVTVFLAILVPVYLHTYGPTNFLWFCDAALVLTTIGMWLESPLLISMCAVGILLPQAIWLADYAGNLLSYHGLGLTSYMFDSRLSRFTRALSLFHVWLPLLLIWLLFRVGYDRRALSAWTGLAAVIGLFCYLFTPPAGVIPDDPNLPVNINYLYGFDDRRPQHWMNQNIYALLWLGVLWFVLFLPTHLILRKLFASPTPPVPKVAIRFV